MKLAKKCEKVILMSMVAALIVSPTYAATKNEMVFVSADSTGEVEKIIVSNHLETHDEGDVKDISELTNIINLKGDEEPTLGVENELTWQTDGKDVYYQGETTKALPVQTEVTYILDGKEVEADTLSGASGHLKIIIKQTNTVKEDYLIGGENRALYVPFYSLGVVMIDADVMQNMTLTNAKMMSDGSRKIVVGIMLPGMSENLGEDIDVDFISDTMEIEGDIENFKLSPMYLSTSAKLPDLDSIESSFDVDEIKEGVDELEDATNQLLEGTKTLSDSLTTYTSKIKVFQEGLDRKSVV